MGLSQCFAGIFPLKSSRSVPRAACPALPPAPANAPCLPCKPLAPAGMGMEHRGALPYTGMQMMMYWFDFFPLILPLVTAKPTENQECACLCFPEHADPTCRATLGTHIHPQLVSATKVFSKSLFLGTPMAWSTARSSSPGLPTQCSGSGCYLRVSN